MCSTVAENIMYGAKEVKNSQIREKAELTNSKKFIEKNLIGKYGDQTKELIEDMRDYRKVIKLKYSEKYY